jgi:hypothetical protein
VALSVRDRSRAGAKSRGRSIHQHDSECLSCSSRLSLGRSVTWADHTANMALVLTYIGAKLCSYVAMSPLANHLHNSHGRSSLFCPSIESPPSTLRASNNSASASSCRYNISKVPSIWTFLFGYTLDFFRGLEYELKFAHSCRSRKEGRCDER